MLNAHTLTEYQKFREIEEIDTLISSSWDSLGEERREEQLLERWKYLLDLYQEQPHLIDPHLPHILGM